MINNKKLEAWAEKLLDTGKRNNLISFKDTKTTTAEILLPDADTVFASCAVGYKFEVFDPKLSDNQLKDEEYSEDSRSSDNEDPSEDNGKKKEKRISREEYLNLFGYSIRNNKTMLVYGQTPNPIAAVKSIAKKAKSQLDETGINVAYLAFGFVRWSELETSEVHYLAPLLLMHVNVITGSVLDPIKIEISDDDVIVNPTFSYLMQDSYGITLPEYSDGDTLSMYLDKVRSIVKRLKWDVISSCKLGIFSFLKLNMYEDLKNNADQILANDNVKMILGESNGSGAGTIVGTSDEEFKRVDNPLIDLHTVVEADSSQIEAIEMAKCGKSFVLQGPPGTGKSQTITNIIAECLYDGKKVLFVSEKQAALNVVYDKLQKAGLADFCLELHSHKANKKAIIEELNRTLEAQKIYVSSNAEEEIRQKKTALTRLDAYAEALHQQRPKIEKSLYQLFELYAAFRDCPDITFRIPNIQDKGEDYLLEAIHLLEQYVSYIPSIGYDYRQNTWYGFKKDKLTYDEREELRGNLATLLRGYRELKDTTEEIVEKYESTDFNYVKTKRWQRVLEFLASSGIVTPRMLSWDAIQLVAQHITVMSETGRVIVGVRNELFSLFKPEILGCVNGAETLSKLVTEYSSVFTRAVNKDYKKIIVQLQSCLLNPGKIKYQQAVSVSEQLKKYQETIVEFRQHEEVIEGYLGISYKGVDTDWSQAISEIENVKVLLHEGQESFGVVALMNDEIFQCNRHSYEEDQKTLKGKIDAVEIAKNRIQQVFDPEILDLESDDYNKCTRKLENCLNEVDRLGNWSSFSGLISQMDSMGILQYINTAIDNQIDSEKIVGAFRRVFYKQWIELILFSDVEIATFSRVSQDQMIQLFAKKDELQYEISKAQIKSTLSNNKPDWNIVAGGSAVSVLRREGNKKRKQLAIRKLLAEIGSLVQVLKPCFLMSPLSVSTFLNSEKIHFDTVVFDEASQIFPQDAIGAVYRGTQLIVVGDSRQMPPSNFFSSSVNGDDEEDEEVGDVNDFESILDICSAVFTTERLAWHYRSHYEQLIAFSNRNFYNNTLVTFPSAKTDRKGIGVDFFHVDGTFDRQSKTNRVEAEFIVDLIYQNIQEYPKRSLGVVAFSVAQQNLIDNLLSQRRVEKPEFEPFFAEDKKEPFFVKNLETVQGDERDTIIFSIAYAKDIQGRFIHNFGPLNRAGGERRLNVAVTRAKDNVQIVSSIRYTDINLNNTGSEGARLLRAYLDYAENGEKALERMIDVEKEDRFDSAFELEVCEFLRDHGYAVDTQVGCSGYRIDLGLRRPNSSDYLLAIECDGATYHKSKNARDRDRLRQQVLENMGWTFYRIWSTDWYRNNYDEKKRLLQAVEDAMQSDEKKEITQKKTELAEEDEAESPCFEVEAARTETVFAEYIMVDTYRLANRFHVDFRGAVKEILLKEAPLSEEWLMRRIAWLFDREKASSVVQQQYMYQMRGCQKYGIGRRNGFLYLADMKDIRLRVPGDKRDIKFISLEELEDGFLTLILKNISVSREGLCKKMNMLLGFNRTGRAITERYDTAIRNLIRKGLVVEEDGVLELGPSVSEEWKKNQMDTTTVSLSDRQDENDTVNVEQDTYNDYGTTNTPGLDEADVEEVKQVIRDCIIHNPFSRKSLLEKIRSEGFSAKVSSFAVDDCGIDWVFQAKRYSEDLFKNKGYTKDEIIEELVDEGFPRRVATKAAEGLDWVSRAKERIIELVQNEAYSPNELIDELESEEFNKREIVQAMDDCDIDWEEQARKKAEVLLDDASYSKLELIEELIDSEGFKKQDAIAAVRGISWVTQAKRVALDFLVDSIYSRMNLIEDIEGEGFSREEATEAVDSCNVNWLEQAVKYAEECLENGDRSFEDIFDSLMDEGYTREQAEYGAKKVLGDN